MKKYLIYPLILILDLLLILTINLDWKVGLGILILTVWAMLFVKGKLLLKKD